MRAARRLIASTSRLLRGRPRAVAFWHLRPDSLVAAVLEDAAEEPLLLACAGTQAVAGAELGLFAAGIVEVADGIGAAALPQVAALPRELAWLERENEGATWDLPVVVAPVESDGDAGDGWRAVAPAHAVVRTRALFASAGLSLRALDCEDCALSSLHSALGAQEGAAEAGALGGVDEIAGGRILGVVAGGAALPDPLAAVSVAPGAELAASALGPRLAVPIGLALGWFGCAPEL